MDNLLLNFDEAVDFVESHKSAAFAINSENKELVTIIYYGDPELFSDIIIEVSEDHSEDTYTIEEFKRDYETNDYEFYKSTLAVQELHSFEYDHIIEIADKYIE
jgi:hypothetical protein